MAVYTYKAKKPDGETASGTLNAQNESDAVGDLRRQGLVVVSLNVQRGGSEAAGKPSFFSMSVGGGGPKKGKARVNTQEMVVFTRQLSTMIGAGIPLVEAIEILEEQVSNLGFKATLADLVKSMRAGKDLSQALSQHPRIFPDIYVNMIKAGEASGQLDVVLSRLADYQEASAKLKAEIKSAMTYPVVSLIMIVGITLFLLVFIIPSFKDLFNSINADLPPLTKGLLATSLFLKDYIAYWSCGVAVLVVGLVQYFKTERGRWIKDWAVLKIPVFGTLFSKVAISRFSRTFATLMQSGVPILGALEIVSETCGNRLFSRAIMSASESVRQGETLGDPLSQSHLFPPMVTRMISIGEKTGALETLLEKIADFYDQQVKTTVDSLTSLIEPLMIGFMGFLVGGMVLAIFQPIFEMINNLSGK